MNLSIIAAIGKNHELGKNNSLIWHLPKDLKHFKNITNNKVIIMGRKTFESLPRILPNRKHIVFSRYEKYPSEIEVYKDIKDFLEKYRQYNEEMFVIGGAQIYREFLDYVDKLYLTEIDAEDKSADTFFPEFDKQEFQRIEIEANEEKDIKYKHVLYRRL